MLIAMLGGNPMSQLEDEAREKIVRIMNTFKLLISDATHEISALLPFGCSVSVQNPRIGVVWTPKYKNEGLT